MQLEINEKIVYYQFSYSDRSSLLLELTPEGMVTVKAPKKTEMKEIEQFLRKLENANAIVKLYDYLENRQFISSKKKYMIDENYLYLGRTYKLIELPKFELPENLKQKSDEYCNANLTHNINFEYNHDLKELLKKYYTKETKRIIKKRVKYFEKIIGVKAKDIKIVESPGTWGTCNSYRELTFNYRLSMAPLVSIDYVVIHELCHIHHMNHDRSFWREVGSIDKDYKKHAEFFEKYGAVMTV